MTRKISKWSFFTLVLAFFLKFAFSQKNDTVPTIEFDCVTDEKKAIEIAESVWLKAFGEGIYKRKPFMATLKDSTIWTVRGTLNTKKGGVPYVEIRKADCKILKVLHGK
jgi:hypothetical protein